MNFSVLETYLNINKSLLEESSGNNSQKWIDFFKDDSKLSPRDFFIIASYSVIVIVSIFGNSLVCNIVARNASMRSTTYVFIANLALSDLIMTVLNIPFNVARILLSNWPFGSFMCSFVPLVQVTTVYVSTFTMTCIAVDRYRMIIKPLKPRMKMSKALQVIAGVWLLSFILSLPYAIFNKLIFVFTFRPLIRCRPKFPKGISRWLELITLMSQYVIPLSVTGVLYCLIVAKVWSRGALGVVTEAQMISQARAKRKTIKMLVVVVVLFALCWLPINVFHVLREFIGTQFMYTASTSTTDHSTIFFFCHWLAMSSVCYNPFIYCWLNEHFRRGAIHCFVCIRNVGRQLNSSLKSVRRLDNTQASATQSTDYKLESIDCARNSVSGVDTIVSNKYKLKYVRTKSQHKFKENMIPMKSYCITQSSGDLSIKLLIENRRYYKSFPNIEKVCLPKDEMFVTTLIDNLPNENGTERKPKSIMTKSFSWN